MIKTLIVLESLVALANIVSAFILILVASFLIYIFGWMLAPKSAKNKEKETTYACGEEASFRRVKITLSLHNYLIYFVIMDSSVLLIAFASLSHSMLNLLYLLVYLALALTATFLLFEGGEK
ncbi:MAG: NADH-quinone oxidoreductase subunit A [Candidatus Bathyarchaeales archaeon]